MLLSKMSNLSNQKSSLCPANGRQTVGDGAFTFDNEPSVLAVCHMQGADDMYYYSTTFSGGPGLFKGSLRSGVFDVPKAKCPPDRGSSECVTGNQAPSSPSQYSDYYPSPLNSPPVKEKSSASHPFFRHPTSCSTTLPRSIPSRNSSIVSTPPLTPDTFSDYSDGSGSSFIAPTRQKDALDFLMTVFPHQGLSALPYAKTVSISAPNMGTDFEGIVLEIPGAVKTLYVDGKSAESVGLRESIVALLDLADENLGCNALVIVLERSSPNLGNILHSLMYVGGTVVTNPPFQVDPAFVLVGLEI
ncbi:hypothetical protein D9619_001823 [Psilocybe cf. subviscida]|uniref:Ornithine decarboxylase antizyme n=1 Tax=Psilocybe cf. subviscida TaxID=2480587 RepID=A0A8H5F221_9AGAR|nr:hypothetical protein D9619_001823 [Psilocybe cf. subviscida]